MVRISKISNLNSEPFKSLKIYAPEKWDKNLLKEFQSNPEAKKAIDYFEQKGLKIEAAYLGRIHKYCGIHIFSTKKTNNISHWDKLLFRIPDLKKFSADKVIKG
ncbi:hypothetical protein IJ750_04020 [bacterium]|nr:hypothetical protein [bacterium]